MSRLPYRTKFWPLCGPRLLRSAGPDRNPPTAPCPSRFSRRRPRSPIGRLRDRLQRLIGRIGTPAPSDVTAVYTMAVSSVSADTRRAAPRRVRPPEGRSTSGRPEDPSVDPEFRRNGCLFKRIADHDNRLETGPMPPRPRSSAKRKAIAAPVTFEAVRTFGPRNRRLIDGSKHDRHRSPGFTSRLQGKCKRLSTNSHQYVDRFVGVLLPNVAQDERVIALAAGIDSVQILFVDRDRDFVIVLRVDLSRWKFLGNREAGLVQDQDRRRA